MKHHTSFFRGLGLASLVILAAGFSACSNNDDDAPLLPSGEALTRDLIVNGTTETADPVDVNGLNLQFSEDPNAFNDLLD